MLMAWNICNTATSSENPAGFEHWWETACKLQGELLFDKYHLPLLQFTLPRLQNTHAVHQVLLERKFQLLSECANLSRTNLNRLPYKGLKNSNIRKKNWG